MEKENCIAAKDCHGEALESRQSLAIRPALFEMNPHNHKTPL